MSRVRTNIEIEETYVEAIMDRYGVPTKTEAVELALHHLAGQPIDAAEALPCGHVRHEGSPLTHSPPTWGDTRRHIGFGANTTGRLGAGSINVWLV